MAELLSPPKGFVVEKPKGFDAIFDRTLRLEGRKPDESKLGSQGVSQFGVTQETFNAFNKQTGRQTRDVKTITEPEAKEIYRKEFFDRPKFSKLDPDLGSMLFDFGVQSSPKRASKALQKAVGATPDGIIGPKTLKAVQDKVRGGKKKEVMQKIIDDRSGPHRRVDPNKARISAHSKRATKPYSENKG